MSDTDIKKLIDSAQRALVDGSAKEWTATNVRIGAVEFGTVTTKVRRARTPKISLQR